MVSEGCCTKKRLIVVHQNAAMLQVRTAISPDRAARQFYIIHSDLSGGRMVETESPIGPHGVAAVASGDFGMHSHLSQRPK